jgi:DNA-binding MarR family transcriptional regulator
MAEKRGGGRRKPKADAGAPPEYSEAGEPFPPLSTSLDTFLVDGSDREFRKLIYDVLSVSSLMLRARERFGAFIGVTAPQYSMMMAIGEARQITVTQLADRLHVSSPFVTSEIGKLIKRQIVERRPNEADRRSSLLVLTPTGQDLIRRVGPYRRRGNDLVFGSLTGEQAASLQQILATLLTDAQRALHELDSPAWLKHEDRPEEPKLRRPPARRGR